MSTASTGSVSDLITAGESLYTAVSGGEISSTAAANINDAGSVVSLIVSLAARNVTAVNVAGIVGGVTQVLTGVTQVVESSKKTTTTTATTATTSAS